MEVTFKNISFEDLKRRTEALQEIVKMIEEDTDTYVVYGTLIGTKITVVEQEYPDKMKYFVSFKHDDPPGVTLPPRPLIVEIVKEV